MKTLASKSETSKFATYESAKEEVMRRVGTGVIKYQDESSEGFRHSTPRPFQLRFADNSGLAIRWDYDNQGFGGKYYEVIKTSSANS